MIQFIAGALLAAAGFILIADYLVAHHAAHRECSLRTDTDDVLKRAGAASDKVDEFLRQTGAQT